MKKTLLPILLATASSGTGATLSFISAAVDTDITNPANWSGGVVPPFGTSSVNRLDIESATTYTAAQGTTTFTEGRGLGIDTGGHLTVTGGVLNIGGAEGFIGNDSIAGPGSLTIDGGTVNILQPTLNAGRLGNVNSNITLNSGAFNFNEIEGGGDGAGWAGVFALDINGGIMTGTQIEPGDFASDATAGSSFVATIDNGLLDVDVIRGHSATDITVNSGGILEVRALLSDNATTSNVVTLNGGTLRSGDTDNAENWVRSDAGGYQVAIGANGGTFDSKGQNGQVIQGAITGSSGGDVTFTGGGQIVLTGNNTYDGDTLITGNTTLTINGLVNELPDATVITVGAGSTLDMAKSDTIGGIAGTGTIDLNASFLGLSGSEVSWSGNLLVDLLATDSFGQLINSGSGTLDLTGVFLAGTSIEFDPGTAFLIISGATSGSLSNADALTGDEIAFLDGAGHAGLTDGITLGSQRYGIQYGSLTLIAIPEPSAALLGGVGLLTLFRRRR